MVKKVSASWGTLIGLVYGKLRVCVRGFSEGKSEASKLATNIGLVKSSNFLYTVLAVVIFHLLFL